LGACALSVAQRIWHTVDICPSWVSPSQHASVHVHTCTLSCIGTKRLPTTPWCIAAPGLSLAVTPPGALCCGVRLHAYASGRKNRCWGRAADAGTSVRDSSIFYANVCPQRAADAGIPVGDFSELYAHLCPQQAADGGINAGSLYMGSTLHAHNLAQPQDLVHARNLVQPQDLVHARNLVQPQDLVHARNLVQPQDLVHARNLVQSHDPVQPQNLVHAQHLVLARNLVQPQNLVHGQNLVPAQHGVQVPQSRMMQAACGICFPAHCTALQSCADAGRGSGGHPRDMVGIWDGQRLDQPQLNRSPPRCVQSDTLQWLSVLSVCPVTSSGAYT
jgi:hypothetical protein